MDNLSVCQISPGIMFPVGNTAAARDSFPSDPGPENIDGCSSQVLGRKISHRNRKE